MPRTRLVPDKTVFAAVLRLLDKGGEKAVSFGTVAAVTGLAPPTLAQRYQTRDGMVRAARTAAWDDLDARTTKAVVEAADKGPQGFLKAIGTIDAGMIAAGLKDPELSARATGWRAAVEAALAMRLGQGQKGREAAALLFAAWQGQALWTPAGDSAFRLKDAVKRLT
jgi:hypothetical protein